jgi:hypothetical protein
MSNIVNKHNDIWEWHNVLEDANHLINSIQENKWEYYTNKGGGETIIGRAAVLNKGEEFYEKATKAFLDCVAEYSEHNGLSFKDNNVGTDWLLVREYNTGSKMSAHNDAYSYVKKDGQPVRPSLTAILYINDEYTGGEIDFIHDDLCIKPQAGSMVIFPSHKQHEVLEILSGDRYMTQTYVYENPVSFYDKI